MTTVPYAPERFEYRIWGDAFGALPSPAGEPATSEVYLLPDAVDGINAKFRRDALEIKRLLGERKGLQRWLPELRCPLPLPARVIERHLCPALGVGVPRLAARDYDLAHFLDEVAGALPGVRVLSLRKRRRSFPVAGARAERTWVTVGALTLETIAVEAESFKAAAEAARELDLRRAPNVDYVAALRRILAGEPPAPPGPQG
jgi:hypothetical protein